MKDNTSQTIAENNKQLEDQLLKVYDIPDISVRIPLRLVIFFSKNKNNTYLKTFLALKSLCEGNGYIEMDLEKMANTLELSIQSLKRHLKKLQKWNFIGKANRSATGYFVRSWKRVDRELSKVFDLQAKDYGFSDNSIKELQKGTKKIANRQRFFVFNLLDFFTLDSKAVLLYSRLSMQIDKQEYMELKNKPALNKSKKFLKKMSDKYEANENLIASYKKSGMEVPMHLIQEQADLKPFHLKHENALGFAATMGERSLSKLYGVSKATANRYRNRMHAQKFIEVIYRNQYINGTEEELRFHQRMLEYAGIYCYISLDNQLVIPKANQIRKTNIINTVYRSKI